MNYFDLHCDTPFELLKRNSRLKDGSTHITAERLSGINKYAQITDIWSQNSLPDETCYENFFKIYNNYMAELEMNPGFMFCRDFKDLQKAEESSKRAVFLGVEGGKLLSDNISRLDTLYEKGVRFLTLVWGGECLVGGAHGTDAGLTDFGRQVIEKCGRLGIVVDVSHGSDKLTDEAVEICSSGKIPAIASHSNSRAVCSHDRNLTDERAKRIASAGGIIGVSLANIHLKSGGGAEISDVIKHILHYLNLGLGKSVCFGCDFDGTDLPLGMTDVSSMELVYSAALSAGISKDMLSDIFYSNARRYFEKYLKAAG